MENGHVRLGTWYRAWSYSMGRSTAVAFWVVSVGWLGNGNVNRRNKRATISGILGIIDYWSQSHHRPYGVGLFHLFSIFFHLFPSFPSFVVSQSSVSRQSVVSRWIKSVIIRLYISSWWLRRYVATTYDMTWHIRHTIIPVITTSHIPHSTFHIPHSTSHSTHHNHNNTTLRWSISVHRSSNRRALSRALSIPVSLNRTPEQSPGVQRLEVS